MEFQPLNRVTHLRNDLQVAQRRELIVRTLALTVLATFGLLIGSARAAEETPDLFVLPITVENLEANAQFLPLTTELDLSRALEDLQVSGSIDERSLRLFHVSDTGARSELPLQFTPAPQPRPRERRLLPGTSPTVSYLGEYAPGETPPGIRVAGTLTWLAQVEPSGHARYELRFGTLRAGRAIQVPFPPQNLRSFDEDFRTTPVRWFAEMQLRPQWPLDGMVHVLDGTHEVTAYHLGPPPGQSSLPAPHRPFLYPVNGPDGISLTELGKPHDPTGSHAHHYSLWIAHASVQGKDFWSEQGGIIAHEQLEQMEDGPLFCRLVQRTRWLDGTMPMVRGRREFTFYTPGPDFRIIDLDLQLTPAGTQAVTFGKTTFGFLAARVAQSMNVFDGSGEILNANGQRNEQGAHHQHASWIDQSGPIAQDRWNGITLMDHPDNLNFPTAWHCRNDGWAGAAFNIDHAYTLEAGHTLHLRYRILLHRGNAAVGQVALRFSEYASKPAVHIGRPSPEISTPTQPTNPDPPSRQ